MVGVQFCPEIQNFFSNIFNMLAFDASRPMLFSSGLFWFLFLIFLPIYSLLRDRKWQMLFYVVGFSLFFYYKSSGIFFLLIMFTSLVDWLMSRLMDKAESKVKKRVLLTLSIVFSVSILAYFKYANFFLWNWNQMVQGNFQPLDIILPVGISFYTFQSISYVVDVYRKKIEPTASWLEYIFFLSFFPQLVAGPIVRADHFLPQIQNKHHATKQEVYAGLWLILIGVIKKTLVADYIAQYNDLIFSSPTGYSGFESLMGVMGYTMQIYCDFSGYSDMAIGLAMIMGFNLGINFNFPYRSQNITEFWHRWHISLSTWLRDYIYIPLGGNRKGTIRTYINNFLTMLIGGLWHGAAWKFVFWGAIHGAGLIIHKACKPYLSKVDDNKFVIVLSWFVTMTFVSLLWVFFRADSFSDSILIIRNIFERFDFRSIVPFMIERRAWCIMMLLIAMAHLVPTKCYEKLSDKFISSPWIIKLIIFIVVIQTVIEFMNKEVSPFIYFQF